MHHGPDPYARALADLDELLERRDRSTETWVLDAAREVDRVRALCRSLRAAIREALTEDLSAPVRHRLLAVLHQSDEVDR